MKREEVGPEFGALLATRRWLVVIAIGAAWLLTTVFGISSWQRTSTVEHALHVLSGVLVLAGLALGARSRYLWLSVAGLTTLVLATAVAPDGSPAWVPLGTMSGYAMYIALTLCSRRVGLVLVFAGAAALALVWSTRPASAIPGGLAFWGGWVQVGQQLAGSLAMWWAWNVLVREARRADDMLIDLQERTAAAIAVQERARLWRATATRVHESVLNSIRYVLHDGEIDRGRLSLEIARERAPRDSDGPFLGASPAALLQELRADDVVGDLVTVLGNLPGVRLDADVFRAARAALIEVSRNSVRHGGATEIVVAVRQCAPERISVEVSDNGRGLSGDSRPGIGTTTVLDSSLSEVGGRWSLAANPGGGSSVTMEIPCLPGQTARSAGAPGFASFDKGRLLVTAPLAGTVGVGALYYVGLLSLGGLLPVLAMVAGFIGSATAIVVVLRRTRLPRRVSILLVLVPALVPWLLLGDAFGCGDAASVSRSINMAGFAMMVIVAWGGRLAGVVGVPVWGVGSILLASAMSSDCRGFSLVALLNSVIALPLILTVTYAGARAYERAQDRTQLARQREIAERSRALAAIDVNMTLEDSVEDAVRILGDIAQGAPVDDARRRDLERIDGRIRAGIQVDPQSDGAMAVLAKSLVDEVASLGVTLNVRSLVASRDQRALPLPVQHTLYRLLAASSRTPAVIQVFTDGEEDHLSVVVDREALVSAGLRPGATIAIDDVSIEVDDEPLMGESAAEIAVLFSRPIDLAAGE